MKKVIFYFTKFKKSYPSRSNKQYLYTDGKVSFILPMTRLHSAAISSAIPKGEKPLEVPLTSIMTSPPVFISWIASTVQISSPPNIVAACSAQEI